MSYPTELNISDVDLLGDDGQDVSTASDGTPRIDILHVKTAYRMTVTHVALDAAGEAALTAYYEANKASTFDFVDPAPGGHAYRCKFASRPRRRLYAGGFRRDMTVELVGVINA